MMEPGQGRTHAQSTNVTMTDGAHPAYDSTQDKDVLSEVVDLADSEDETTRVPAPYNEHETYNFLQITKPHNQSKSNRLVM